MNLQSRIVRQRRRRICLALVLALCGVMLVSPNAALGEGSRTLYPRDSPTDIFRANLEWRDSSYGKDAEGNDLLFRRTLLKVYANAGEYILLGSSAVGVVNGDILVYNPNLVTGEIGREIIPDKPSFSCVAQRTESGIADQGRIASREEEVIGPNTIDNPSGAGYNPCSYLVPESGIYNVVFYGPRGPGSDEEENPTGQIEPDPEDFTRNFGFEQDTSVTMWDVTVRSSLTSTENISGRLFA
ncbi:MAG: hypothetical protein MI924_08940, partial [Chloroflexales bacterium]|nr:hypothetical protein [Chloroflexales bacterium]